MRVDYEVSDMKKRYFKVTFLQSHYNKNRVLKVKLLNIDMKNDDKHF